MANRYRENYSTIVIIMEMQVKTIIRCLDLCINIAKTKRLIFPDVGKNMEQSEFYALLVTNHSISEPAAEVGQRWGAGREVSCLCGSAGPSFGQWSLQLGKESRVKCKGEKGKLEPIRYTQCKHL